MKKKLITGAAIALLSTSLSASMFSQQPSSKYSSYNNENKPAAQKTVYKEKGDSISELESRSNIVYVDRKEYLAYSMTFQKSEESFIFSKQPVDELVGEGGVQNEIRYGRFTSYSNTGLPTSRVFLYGWQNSEKNNEIGLGFGGDLMGQPFQNKKINLYLGSQVGFGMQKMKGDTKTISTSLNKLSFVTDKGVLDPTEATFQDDTYVLQIGLNLGASYEVKKDLFLDVGYIYTYNQYQVDYRTGEDDRIRNNMSFNQDSHGIKFAINYRF